VVTTRYYAKELEKAGASVSVSIYPGIDQHQTPPDFEAQLENWIHQLRDSHSN
jgi:predicted esterase